MHGFVRAAHSIVQWTTSFWPLGEGALLKWRHVHKVYINIPWVNKKCGCISLFLLLHVMFNSLFITSVIVLVHKGLLHVVWALLWLLGWRGAGQACPGLWVDLLALGGFEKNVFISNHLNWFSYYPYYTMKTMKLACIVLFFLGFHVGCCTWV